MSKNVSSSVGTFFNTSTFHTIQRAHLRTLISLYKIIADQMLKKCLSNCNSCMDGKTNELNILIVTETDPATAVRQDKFATTNPANSQSE